jgi:hypothetical protein
MIVGLWTDDVDKTTKYIATILGTTPSGQVFMPHRKSLPVSIVDLSIMDALVNEPKLSFGKLVKSTRLSPKTVRKHLNRLLETKTISIVPLLGALADKGELIYPLVITGTIRMNEVQKILDETALLRSVEVPPMKYVLCRANSLADVIAKIIALENIKGIKSVTLSLNREVLISEKLRHYLIKEKIKKLERERLI